MDEYPTGREHSVQMGKGVVCGDTEGDGWRVVTLGIYSPGCCTSATWVSASPFFPPGCPGPQDQLREIMGQVGCSLQCSLANLHLAPTVHKSAVEPGKAEEERWQHKKVTLYSRLQC